MTINTNMYKYLMFFFIYFNFNDWVMIVIKKNMTVILTLKC